jgi:dienelactone hydrolase
MASENQNISYTCGDTRHAGYLAWDGEIAEPRPGIVVIHEWWGLNDYIRSRADMLAAEGYCALAIDMYGDGLTAGTPDEAGNAMNAVLGDMETGLERLKAGYEALLAQPRVDPSRTAAIGYCFGGAMALHMARKGLPLRAVVSFHGALGSFHQPEPGEVPARILVCHGGNDAMVSMDDVAAFREEMDAAEADYEIIVHPGAMHGFSSREADENGRKYNIPVGYNADADRDSWAAMKKLFDEVF